MFLSARITFLLGLGAAPAPATLAGVSRHKCSHRAGPRPAAGPGGSPGRDVPCQGCPGCPQLPSSRTGRIPGEPCPAGLPLALGCALWGDQLIQDHGKNPLHCTTGTDNNPAKCSLSTFSCPSVTYDPPRGANALILSKHFFCLFHCLL